ncbi:MAG: hypothetical protein QGM50_02935 [Anaerolineae bacterium]|nr:hypothetical protein [Anaerolineae bacterium]MDK1080791.1 hypothetical protein [Anaerolineae bacterium]MDK1117725.1 hypothetical protein [Anaerolineae bacterium]
MQPSRTYWPAWADRLQHWKLTNFATWLLEAGGPFILLSSQALYMASPFIGGKQIEVMARTLEEKDEVNAFASYLREDIST